MKLTYIAVFATLSLLGVAGANAVNALASGPAAMPAPPAHTQPAPPPATTPAPAPITPPVAAKAKLVRPCEQQDATDHDAKLIVPQNEAAWPRSRLEAKRRQQLCNAHKPPPHSQPRRSLYSGAKISNQKTFA